MLPSGYQIELWQLLTLIGIILIVSEVIIPKFILLPIGVAFVLTACFSYLIDSLWTTLGLLGALSIFCVLIFRKYFRQIKKIEDPKNN